MVTSLDFKRLDDLMREIGDLRKELGGNSRNVELGGIWGNASVEEEEFEKAERFLFGRLTYCIRLDLLHLWH